MDIKSFGEIQNSFLMLMDLELIPKYTGPLKELDQKEASRTTSSKKNTFLIYEAMPV